MSQSSYDVTAHREDETKLVKTAQTELVTHPSIAYDAADSSTKNNGKGVEIVDSEPVHVGSEPHFFSGGEDANIIGVITYNFFTGGTVVVSQDQEWVSSGNEGTVIMWPMTTQGMVANTYARRIYREVEGKY